MTISLKSIRGKLLVWIFLSVTMLVAGIGFCLHAKLHDVVFDSVDRTLHANLQLVKGMVHTHDGQTLECEAEEFVQGDYVIPYSGHYYKVFMDGQLLAASGSLPDSNFDLTPNEPVAYNEASQEWMYFSIGPNQEPLRAIRHDFKVVDKAIRIVVADSIAESATLVDRLVSYFLVVMPFMIVLIALVSLTIATVSLRPLQKFSAAIERITHANLDARIEKGNQVVELQGLAEKFNDLLARLQMAFEAEKNLIADAAHELKTPLAVIRAECDIALQKPRSADEHAESLKEIRLVSETMLRQINDLLTLARLDSGMLSASSFESISLNGCVNDAVRLSEPLAERKNVRISTNLHGEAVVQGDRDTLTEAILNIVENAVKYNHPGGFVAVEMNIRGGRAEIVVRDTGVGISEAERERIFDRFYRSELSRSSEGTGLGLSIARSVMEAHAGDVRAAGEAAGGSRFTLTIPLAEPS